jgi:hypothetical protein
MAAAKEVVAAETAAELAQARETIAIGTDLLAAAQVTNQSTPWRPPLASIEFLHSQNNFESSISALCSLKPGSIQSSFVISLHAHARSKHVHLEYQ